MKVLALFAKQKQGAISLMVQQRSLTLQRGHGVVGDGHALVGSPRQVLLVDQLALHTFDLQPGDLSENIVLDGSVAELRSGSVLQIGEALLRITFLCEPCARLERKRQGLMRQIGRQRGVLAMVVRSGEIALGDAAIVTGQAFAPLAEDVKSRFNQFVAQVPAGKVVTTADLVLGLGVMKAYYRSFPALIKTAPSTLPVHRIVTIDGCLFNRYIPNQAERLATEGVTVTADQVSATNRWQPEHFYDLGEWE